jgi:hypothetical protein
MSRVFFAAGLASVFALLGSSAAPAQQIDATAVPAPQKDAARRPEKEREVNIRRQLEQRKRLNDQRHILFWLELQLQAELACVKEVCGPTKEQFRQLKADLQDCAAKSAKASRSASLKSLRENVALCLARRLSPERGARYCGEIEKRDANERAVCIRNLVAILDQELSLSAQQREAMSRSLASNWDVTWCRTVEMAFRHGQNYLPKLPDSVILPILDSTQADVWQGMVKVEDAADLELEFGPRGLFEMRIASPDGN